MPFVPKRRPLRDLALDMAFAPWRVKGAALLPGVVILFLVALGIVFVGSMGRDERLPGAVVAALIVLTLATALATMGALSIAVAWQEWRAHAGRTWTLVSDPACLAAAESFARRYLTGEPGEAYGALAPAARERLSAEEFERVRLDLKLPPGAKEAFLCAAEDLDLEPSDETGPIRQCMVAGFSIAAVVVDFQFADESTRYAGSGEMFLCSHGRAWLIVDCRFDVSPQELRCL